MNDGWNECADGWDTNVDVISYADKAYESLIQVVDIEGQNILDFGCGTGLLTERLSPLANQIVAIDTSPKMIAVLQSKNLPNITALSKPLTITLIEKNTAFDNKFNIVVASSVFSFLPYYEPTLKLLKSLLLSDGLLVQWDWLSSDSNPDFGLSEVAIEKALDNTGFKDITLAKPFSLAFEKGNMPVVMGIAKNA